MVPIRQSEFYLLRLIIFNYRPPAFDLPLPDVLVVVQGHRDDPLLQRLLAHEPYLLLDDPLYLLVEGLDPVVRVDERAQFPRELIEDEHVLGLLRPQLKLWVFALPFGDEIPEGLLPGLCGVLLGYGHEAVGDLPPVRRPRPRAYVPEEVDEAPLPSRLRIRRGYRLIDAGEPVGYRDLYILQPPFPKVREQFPVGLGRFARRDREPDEKRRPVVGYPEGDVYRLLGDRVGDRRNGRPGTMGLVD